MSERLLTPEDVAELLGVPVRTVLDWRHRGIGPYGIRVGRYVRYHPDEVEAWIERQYDGRRPTEEGSQ